MSSTRMEKIFLKKELTQVTPNNRSKINPGLNENELSKNRSGLIGKQGAKDLEKIISIHDIRERKDTEREK